MRYDSEQRMIKIDFKEFVAIARRGISPSLSYDEDEPDVSSLSARRIKAFIGGQEPQRIFHTYSDGEYLFELSGIADAISESTVTIARQIVSNPANPRREELAQIRGEAFVLGYMLAMAEALDRIELRIILVSESSGETAERHENITLAKLKSFFAKCLKVIRIFARPEIDRVTVRLPSLKTMRFPYEKIREGQSEFVRTAYRNLARGGVLYASAPTGTGKTVSALYPALRALGDERVEKIFYLTPKTTTAEAAIDCLEIMASQGASLRAIHLTAKDRCCTEGRICKTSRSLCKNSRENKLSEGVLELFNLEKTVVSYIDIQSISKKYSVCPYELSLTYAELCDVVICDFNYLFDPTVYIKRFFSSRGKYAFLVDEAHNLHERAREMYSAELSLLDITEPECSPLLGEFSATKKISSKAGQVFRDEFFPYVKEELRENREGILMGAANLAEIPCRIFSLFDEITDICEAEITESLRAKDEEQTERTAYLRSYFYKIKKFADILSRFDSGYKAFVFSEGDSLRVKLYCLDTGAVIRRCISLGHSALIFSATLSPIGYYRAVLGGDRSDETLEVSSPFAPEQLSVAIMDTVSTRFSEREDTISAVCRVIAATVSAKRGNYMIFSPSFAYSEALAKAFSSKYPKLHVISQEKNMTSIEKAEFLDEFKRDDDSYLIAFCVMGGIYSEGIDLAGDSLIGAVIVGIGMPALSYEREAIAEYYEEKYEEGKQYAYIYPGMNRVFQAAGRVIRREDDRGVIVLVDDRFDDPIYKKSLPKLWEGVKFIGDAKKLREVLDDFWKENGQRP